MPVSKKFHFLINPISGGGQGKAVFDFLPEIMRSMDFKEDEWKREFSIYESFEEQVKEALESSERVIAVGGDGTATSVFSVLLRHPEFRHVKIGLIPLGTGNDLARVLNLYEALVSRGLLFIVRKLVVAKHRNFDLWKVNGKFAMANYFSAGVDARIAHYFNRDRAEGKIGGKSSVIKNKLHYVKRFFADKSYRLKSGELKITDELGKEKIFSVENYSTIIVGNIPSFAGGSNPFGKSNMADGLLEVLRIKSIGGFIKAILVGYGSVIRAKKIEFKLEKDEFIQLDGEDFKSKLEMPICIEFGGQVNMLHL